MKRAVVFPQKYVRFSKHKERFHGKMLLLGEIMKEKLSFDVYFVSSAADFPYDSDVIFFYAEANAIGFMSSIMDKLPKKTRFIGLFVDYDIHRYDSELFHRILERCDLVLGSSYAVFKRKYPFFISKYVYFPHFFAPHSEYVDFNFNENPKMKCLLSGQTRRQYLIRHSVAQEVEHNPRLRKQIDILEHPRKDCKAFFTRQNKGYEGYVKILHEYFCCLTDSGTPQDTQVVAKYFEIPATGSLLLASVAPDLEQIDLVPNVHFVPIRKETVFSQIEDCLLYPENYQKIRQDGMSLVRRNHSINNRFVRLKMLLEAYA